MLTIEGNKADINEIISRNNLNGVQKQMLDILSSSRTNYRYNSEKELVFELMLRNEIVKSAQQLAKSKLGFEVFNNSKCNMKYWYRLDDGSFQLKSWVSPSKAINDIFVNSWRYATECSTAITIIYYKALLNVLGKSLFNRYFQNIRLKNWHYLNKLIAEISRMKKYSDYLPGDRMYVKNPDYSDDCPECQGENVIDLGYGRYYGHGIGITDIDGIINELNRNRISNSSRSAYLMNSAGRPDFKKLADIYYR
jgi:protein-glutamine gamma-glutamyltransferase